MIREPQQRGYFNRIGWSIRGSEKVKDFGRSRIRVGCCTNYSRAWRKAKLKAYSPDWWVKDDGQSWWRTSKSPRIKVSAKGKWERCIISYSGHERKWYRCFFLFLPTFFILFYKPKLAVEPMYATILVALVPRPWIFGIFFYLAENSFSLSCYIHLWCVCVTYMKF